MDYTAQASQGFMHSFQLTVKDWPLWIGFAAIDYIGDMLQSSLGGQANPVVALGQGVVKTLEHNYFYATKFPDKAAAQVSRV